MPIYRATIKDSTAKPRLIRAETAAQARNHIVSVETLTAEEMADELEKGATVERADS